MPNGFDKRPRNSFERFLFDRDDGLVSLVEPSDRELIGHIVVDHANKHLGFVKKEDLDRAAYCIQVMKEQKVYRGHKIGRICKAFEGICSYKQDDVVVYQTEDDKTVVVETPMTKEEIKKEQERGSLITTYKTVICVPKNYVQDIPMPE